MAIFVDVGHVAHLVFAAHGFWDLEEKLPFVSDFHGKSTVITTPALIFPDLLKPPGQPLHSMLKLAVNKILGVKIGICVHSYFRTCIHKRLSRVWKWEIMTIVSAEETEIS